MNVLSELTEYLAQKLNMTVGTDAFYFELPAEPTRCIAVLEPKLGHETPAQVDAETHYVEVHTRDLSSDDGYALAQQCKKLLVEGSDSDDTGFITSPGGLFIAVQVYGGPLPGVRNQQGLRSFYIAAMLINKRL